MAAPVAGGTVAVVPGGRKKALLISCNYAGTSAELKVKRKGKGDEGGANTAMGDAFRNIITVLFLKKLSRAASTTRAACSSS
jgi:hypothetical protein